MSLLVAVGVALSPVFISPPAAAAASPSATAGVFTTADSARHKNPRADWRISSIADAAQSQGEAKALEKAHELGLRGSADRVRVIVETDGRAAAGGLATTGARVERSAGKLVQVLASPGQLRKLTEAAGVRYVRPPLAHTPSAVTDEGVAKANATLWQQRGQFGAGVKVGIIDGGFDGYEARQATGDLPANVITQNYCSDFYGTQHGTAVSEIVHKMAPQAELYLICIETEVDLQNALWYAEEEGITVINHSMGWYGTSRGDGSGEDGTPDAIVAEARANGIVWVNSAGNDAQTHWKGNFVNDGRGLNAFSGTDIGNNFTVPVGGWFCAVLKWDDWPYSSQDYDLWVVNAATDYGWVSDNTQDGSVPPVEGMCYENDFATTSFYVAIQRYSATRAPRFDLFVYGTVSTLQYQSAAGSVTEPSSSPSAFAVGAVCWQGTTIESFSSRGPTIDGRTKPDISGPDRVSTAAYGAASACSGGFGGTSASSPHVAGAAALVKGAFPAYTPAQIQSYLETNSTDLGTAGNDNTYGHGLLHLPTRTFMPGAPQSVAASGAGGSAVVSWTAPASNGGATIAGYTVTSAPDGSTCAWTAGPLTCTVTGLTNGVSYTFTVVARNSVGTGPESDPSEAVVVGGVPGAPIDVVAVGGDASATVSWSAPASDGGFPITGYTVTSSPGDSTCEWTPGPLACTFGGLTNGTTYTFTAVATNDIGSGPASLASNGITPATFPGAPTAVHAVPYNESALVIWTAAENGGSAITSYAVTSSPGGSGCIWTAGPLGCTVTGLDNGTAYTFIVQATNGVGAGPESDASAPVTPIAVPDAPTAVTAVRGDGLAVVSWSAPADNKSPISGYTVTSSPDGKMCPWTDGPLSCTVSGLANGTTYTFTVTATNARGTGPDSLPSNAVTPATVPDAPTAVSAVAADGTATVSWSAPAWNGGSAITGYSVTSSPDGQTCTWTSGPLRCTVDGLTNHTPYTFAVSATNDVGTGPASGQSVAVTPLPGATYVPIAPHRLLDTRYATGLSGAFKTGVARTFQVTGLGGVPAGAAAVTGNLTVTGQTSKGYVALGPIATNAPTTSTLNFPLGDNRANGVTVALGAGGTLSATFVGASGSTTQLIFDVTGYFVPNASEATYVALAPSRLLDTRYATGLTGSFRTGVARTFQVSGRGGVLDGATAVTGNVTVTGQTSKGFVSLGPIATNAPTTSTLNFPLGDNRANGVTVALGPGGSLSATFVGSSGSTAQLVFDVTGYFLPDASGATYVALAPSRLLDTRYATGLPGVFRTGVARTFQVTGQGNVTGGAKAVTGNLTVTAQTSKGFVSLGPIASNAPTTSTLNFPTGDARANGVTVALGPGGTLSATFVGAAGSTTQLIFDVTGYFVE